MTQPQTPQERTAWLRERAKHHGMPVADCAQYIRKLREDYRSTGGPGAGVSTSLGLGIVRVPDGTYVPMDPAKLVGELWRAPMDSEMAFQSEPMPPYLDGV